MGGISDRWSSWLLDKRFGGDREWMTTSLNCLYAVRDRVLDNAGLDEASVLLDVGAGDGLVAFGALERYVHPMEHVALVEFESTDRLVATRLAAQFDLNDRALSARFFFGLLLLYRRRRYSCHVT